MTTSFILNIVFSLLTLGFFFWILIKIIDKKNKRDNNSPNGSSSLNFIPTDSLNHNNKRNYPRINHNMPVVIKQDDDEVIAETKDISFMGAFIITSNKFSVNEKIKLNILSKIKPNTWLDAIVIWTNTGLPENKVIIPGFGVKFINIKENEKLLLNMLLSNLK